MQKKFIHIPYNVGGNPNGLSTALRKIGHISDVWILENNYLNYPVDRILLKNNDCLLIKELKKIMALKYIFYYDVIFFNFGSGLFSHVVIRDKKIKSLYKKFAIFLYDTYSRLMSYLEVFLIKLFKKKLLIQFQGDDCRQGDYCLINYEISTATQVSNGYYNKKSDEAKRSSIKFYSKFCDIIYALNPDIMNVLPNNSQFLPYAHVDLNVWQPIYNQTHSGPLKIGHAPTNREFKGTNYIVNAVEKLKKEGYKIDLILIESISNKKAKEIYKKVDIMIDQLFAGWYGGLAVELMSLGKPVVAYIREKDLSYIPSEMQNDLPIINSNSEKIYETIKRLVSLPRYKIIEKGKDSRKFVEKWHNQELIANDIIRQIDLKNKKFNKFA